MEISNIWHFTENNDFPELYGKYESDVYPEIPCLVELYSNTYGVRYWNSTEHCWDDEEMDDYFRDAFAVKKWKYLDSLVG